MGDEPLRLYLCGQLAIERGSTIVAERDFPARQGRRAWAYLVLQRKFPLAREDLAEAIWGDDIPDRWDSTINGIISRLRAMLRQHRIPPAIARIDGDLGRYRLIVASDATIDWERARTAIHLADTALSRGEYEVTLAEARVAMEIAVRGFLIGESGTWVVGQRRALATIQLRALECTVGAEIGRGRPDLAEREARELLRRDPLQEQAYRLLMRAHAAAGNRGQVRRTMEECRAALAVHAESTPSQETTALFRALMRSD